MNKAFIFDMDGVIIDSERVWDTYEEDFHTNLFGKEITKKIGKTVGMSLPILYDNAYNYGFRMDREVFYNKYHEMAEVTYTQATITEGFESLVSKLREMKFFIGLVSASPLRWIDLAFAKTTVRNHFDYILSLHEQEILRHKPYPDGYLEAMKYLRVTPENTIVLEDSNRGIQSAKESGAFTIGFRQNLQKNYQQTGADVYADTMQDVITIVENLLIKWR